MIEFDLGCVQTHYLAAHTPKIAEIAFGTHATAIHNNSRVGKVAIFNGSLPVTLNPRLFKREANRFQ